MSEEKKSLFDRIFKSASTKAETNKTGLEEKIKQRLKSVVYDDEVVNELLPVFVKLQTTEGFETVFELIEAKEKQIEAISGGDWFKQETKPDNVKNETGDDDSDPVDELLKLKYKED